MNIGNKTNGFTLLRKEVVDELNGTFHLFTHDVTKAKLIYIASDDEDKVFGVGFRTPPEDSTGVAHIIEHSVLNGSKKYRTKEPFMDLIKGSLQTFLNAMTYPDKTLYPIASRNDADFHNLMDVYLDAVFNPSIYEKREVFLQEGWHYHILDEKDPIAYKGVVYNEMRGATSSAEDQVEYAIQETLYPDSPYGKNSGGDPYAITDLTYDAFMDFHKRYYHPSNAYLYLYGDMDLEEALHHIQDGYLAHYDYLDIDSTLPSQKRYTETQHINYAYSVATGDPTENKDFLVYSVLLDENQSMKDMIAKEVLSEILVDSQASPLKIALLKAGIGEDVYSITYGIKEAPFSIVAKNTSSKRKEEFVDIIETALKEMVENGVDAQLLEAQLNKVEYTLRETGGHATKGLVYFINSFDTWLYDKDPLLALRYNDALVDLRKEAKDGYFERYIAHHFLDNPHKVILTATPSEGLNAERDKEVEASLKAYKERLSTEELESLIYSNHQLLAMQNREDTPEEKATIPRLSLDDIEPKFKPAPREVLSLNEATLLYHDLFTSNINYLELAFDIEHLSEEEMSLASLLSELIGSMNTENFTYEALSTETFLHTGGIYLGPTAINDGVDPSKFHRKLMVSGKAIGEEKSKKMLDLMLEQFQKTDFTDRERFLEVVKQMKSRLEMGIYDSGHAITMNRVASYFSASSKCNELINGLDFFFFIQDLEKHFDEKYDTVLAQIQSLYKKVFSRTKLVINLTAERDDFEALLPAITSFTEAFPATSYEPVELTFEPERKNEGIKSSANVQYVAKGYDFRKLGYNYSGAMTVTGQILSTNYLHSEIRAKGGAYGAGVRFARAGSLTTFSYRDPNLLQTIAVYDGMAEYLENLAMDQSELEASIIGIIGRLDPPVTNRSKGSLDLNMYLANRSYEQISETIDQARATTLDDLRQYASLLKESMDENYLCVLGNADTIEEHRDVFNTMVSLNG